MPLSVKSIMKIGLQTWGSDGDIRPFLALSGGLSKAGHEVTLVITSADNKNYSSYANEMGFAIIHAGELQYDEKEIKYIAKKIVNAMTPVGQMKSLIKYLFNPLIDIMFQSARKLCIENDLVIGHFLHYPMHIAAEEAKKPYATLTLNHSGISSRYSRIYGVPNLGIRMNPIWWKLFNFLVSRVLIPEANELRKIQNLPPIKNIIDKMLTSTSLNLIAVSAAICQRQKDWPQYQQICGFLNMPDYAEKWTIPKDLKNFIEAGLPPVFITLGSMISLEVSPHKITELLVEGALIAGCRAIVQSNWEQLHDFPDYPEIYKIGRIPHQHIFPYCQAVVHHGGAGTTHSATRYGCPSVIIEHFADQGFFGNELRLLGIAPRLLHRKSVTKKKLAREIKTVLTSPEMKKKAQALSAIMQKENGVQKAVELLEDRFIKKSLQ